MDSLQKEIGATHPGWLRPLRARHSRRESVGWSRMFVLQREEVLTRNTNAEEEGGSLECKRHAAVGLVFPVDVLRPPEILRNRMQSRGEINHPASLKRNHQRCWTRTGIEWYSQSQGASEGEKMFQERDGGVCPVLVRGKGDGGRETYS